jgi:hypothetical protein
MKLDYYTNRIEEVTRQGSEADIKKRIKEVLQKLEKNLRKNNGKHNT